MPSAIWLITLPLGAAPLVYLVRRVGIGGLVAAVVALLSAWLTWQTTPGQELLILGRSFVLDRLTQVTLVILFITTAVLFLISSISVPFVAGLRRNTIEADTMRGAGRTFYPISLGMLGLLIAAMLTHHLGIRAIFIEAAALLAVFIIQGSRLDSVRAAQRFLVLMSLAVPMFLLVSWRLDAIQLSDQLPPIKLLQQTALFAGIGFALWLAIVPFHGWVTITAREASPASAAFIFTTFPAIALLTLIQLVIDAPWLLSASQLGWAILVAGLITTTVGGLLTSIQRGYSGLMAYAALYDLGCTLLILGIGNTAAVLAVLGGLVLRALALTLIAGSISAIRLHLTDDGFAQATGLAKELPFATTGLLIGGLSLAGTPLTFGFALRWQLIQSMTALDPRWSVMVVIAGLGVAIGYLRGIYALLPAASPNHSPDQVTSSLRAREPLLLIAIIVILAIVCLGLGFFPERGIEYLREATIGINLR